MGDVPNIEAMESLDNIGIYKTLLESTKAIPWQINWQTMQFDYIGPQIEKLLGWPQKSWLSAQDWIERIHPEDREYTVNFCVSQSQNGVDHEADYRALRADGGYVWIRDVVHVLRDENGVTTALVGFMFDISERKEMENELIALNKQLAALSCQDGLTGIANRRLFDQILDNEWSRARRHGTPISLIVFDIDHFKQYNDLYGHVEGDNCLISLAKAISNLPLRSSDMFARYGGEEFVMILPETSADAAATIAEKCRSTVEALQIPHEGAASGGVVTISVGVCTIFPSPEDEKKSLIECADKMLYEAKRSGRNRVYAG